MPRQTTISCNASAPPRQRRVAAAYAHVSLYRSTRWSRIAARFTTMLHRLPRTPSAYPVCSIKWHHSGT
jgi:hypothetical protein